MGFTDSRVHSPRPETPEASVRQGHRNSVGGTESANAAIQLLDDEGGITYEFERALQHIFSKYCTPQPLAAGPGALALLVPPEGASLTSSGLDAWAQDTNGSPFTQETKEELIEFLDVNDDGGLTFKGFLQIYQLQTENDEEETWRDLSNHGFDRTLRLVSTRTENEDAW